MSRSAAGTLEIMEDISRFAKNMAKIVGGIREASKIDTLVTALRSQMVDILKSAAGKMRAKRNAGRLKSAAKKVEEGESAVQKAKKLVKYVGKKAIKNPKLYGALGAAGFAYLYHETSDTYEEAKLKCQETCQGFNNVNLSKLKYDQIVNLLYCRDSSDSSKPCLTFEGGGSARGNITLNSCPVECDDIRGTQETEQDTHINSMLYGSCNIKDGNHLYCDYPKYKNSDDSRADFGKIPLDRYTVDNTTKDDLDKQFRDPWHGYSAMKAAGVIEATAAGGVAGKMGSVLTDFPGSSILPLAGGAAGLATSNALIPDDFPGHCLHKLLEHYTNEDPNNFIDGDSLLSNDEDYKYIRKCKDSSDANRIYFGPDETDVRKCNLSTGEVVESTGNTDTDIYGTCIAWKKSPSDGQGKCLPTMHSSHLSTIVESGGCLEINNSSDCNNHEYCYWVQDGNREDPDLDNIYFCLNDKSLIDIHNGILDNDDDLYLINQLHGQSSDIEGTIDESMDYSIKKFNKYSGGEGDSKQEIDVGDICNNYCNNYLCHEPYISMSLIPGINNAEDYIKMIINIIIKIIIILLGGIGAYIPTRSTTIFLVVICILSIIDFYVYGDKIDEIFEPYSKQIVDFIVDFLP
jgi:hypothetical protein